MFCFELHKCYVQSVFVETVALTILLTKYSSLVEKNWDNRLDVGTRTDWKPSLSFGQRRNSVLPCSSIHSGICFMQRYTVISSERVRWSSFDANFEFHASLICWLIRPLVLPVQVSFQFAASERFVARDFPATVSDLASSRVVGWRRFSQLNASLNMMSGCLNGHSKLKKLFCNWCHRKRQVTTK